MARRWERSPSCCRRRDRRLGGNLRDRRRQEEEAAHEPDPPHRLPGGIHARADGEPDHAVDAIARRKRNVDPALSARGYLAATKRVRAPAEFAKDVPTPRPRASFSRRCTNSLRRRRPGGSPRPAHRVPPELEEGQSGLREGAQPHTVRRPDHRLDHRARGARAERSEAGRRRHLQPPACRDVAWPRRNRSLRPAYPAGKAPDGRAGERFQPVQHAHEPRLAADADLEPRARCDGGSRASGEGELPLLLSQARQGSPLLHREPRAFNAYKAAHPAE